MAKTKECRLIGIPYSGDSSVDQWNSLGIIPAADAGTVVYHSARFPLDAYQGQEELSTTVAFFFTLDNSNYDKDAQGNVIGAKRGMEVMYMASNQSPQSDWVPAFIDHYHAHMVYLRFVNTGRLLIDPATGVVTKA